jgi:hypothetical protein
MPHQLPSSLTYFMEVCDKLGISSPGLRAHVLLAAVKGQIHENVLFLMCARDYIYNPTDLKWEGIESLFLGPGKPFQINVGDDALGGIMGRIRNPAVDVKLENGAAHKITDFTFKPGIYAGGAGNYNLRTKTLAAACSGLSRALVNDMIKQVTNIRTGAADPRFPPHRLHLYMQDMRNRLRRFWPGQLHELGL